MPKQRIRLPVTVTPIEGGHAIVIDPGSLSDVRACEDILARSLAGLSRPLPPPLPPQGWTDEQRAEWVRSREAKPAPDTWAAEQRAHALLGQVQADELQARNEHTCAQLGHSPAFGPCMRCGWSVSPVIETSTKVEPSGFGVVCEEVTGPGPHPNMPCVIVTDLSGPVCRFPRMGHAGPDGVCMFCGVRYAPPPPEKWTPDERRELDRRRKLADAASAVTAKKAREEEELRERMREQDAASAAERARKERDERREKAEKAELLEELQASDATISELRESLANEQSEARDVVEAHRQTHETYRLLGATLEAVREKLEELIEAYADRAPFDDRALFEARLALHDVENALDSDPGHPEPND